MDWDLSTATVGQSLRVRAEADPERVAIEMIGEGAETFSSCYDASVRMAQALVSADARPGDSVVVMSPNCLTGIHAWLGANLAGAVEVTINTAYRGRLLEHALNTSRARLMIAAAEFLPVLRESEANLGFLERIAYFEASPGGPARALPTFERVRLVPLGELIAEAPACELPAVGPTDIASVIYTSGTTGPAKGVLMPHAQVCALARQSIDGLRIGRDDVFYCFHPMFHMAGKFMAVFATLVAGGRVVLDRQFKPELWVDRVRDHGATVALAHGPMVEMIHAQPPRPEDAQHAVSRLLTAPFPKAIAEAFEARFKLKGVEVWGMTEVNIGCWRSLDEPLRLGSCGRVSDEWVELRIVDPETDEELPTGDVGEFVVRPRRPFAFMQGYMGMPDKTVQTWRNLWFHTGDAGYIDADGYCYFVDRLGDRIRRRAENISSYDLESAALTHPAVSESAAIGVPSGFEADDDIKLCVVAKPGLDIDPAELIAHLLAQLPHYMVPRYVEVLPALPRTPTNKVKKAELRAEGIGERTWDRKAAGLALKDLAVASRGAQAS